MEGTGGTKVSTVITHLQETRQGGLVLQVHRNVQHAIGRPGEAGEAVEAALHINHAAENGQLGRHGLRRDVSRDVGDPDGGEGLRKGPAMDAGAAGGGPGHSSVQPVNGGGENVVRLNGDQQLLQDEVDIEGDDLERGEDQIFEQKVPQLRNSSCRFYSFKIHNK
jgi:hypothetical protein